MGVPLLHPRGIQGGPDGYTLQSVDGVPMWVPNSALADPTTTLGDLIVNDGSGIDRLGVGSDGEFLGADSTAPLGVSWKTPAGGGGGGGASYALDVDAADLHATYGDHFAGSSLDAKWTRVTYVSGDETYQQAGGSWLKTAARTTGAYYYQAWGGGTSDFTLVLKAIWHATQTAHMVGLIAVDSSGAGVAGGWYNGSDDAPVVVGLNAGITYNGTFATQSPKSAPRGTAIANSGLPCWYKLVRSGNTWKTALSMNGQVWSPYTSTITSSFTPARIGFGAFQAAVTTVPGGMAVDFFDVQV